MAPAATITLDDLDFELPPDLIAQRPAPERGGSRLLVLEAGAAAPSALGRFDELLLDQIHEGDLVVANDSRVLHARIPIRRSTGGAGEVLLLTPATAHGEQVHTTRWTAMARPARKFRPGEVVSTCAGGEVRFVERTTDQTWLVEIPTTLDAAPAWLMEHGELPLPPYITERETDEARYQTVFAREDGSVAAPTAGLHFDENMWSAIAERAQVAHITLHVGAGTFLPINEQGLDAHVMHHERFEVPKTTDIAVRQALADGRRVVSIGTTTTRTLEHVYGGGANAPLAGSTDLFIVPGHPWACVGAMLTNFHLPSSTLIALVMAFHGIEATRAAYRHAIAERMRFYSFGDAMFIHGPPARM